MHFFWSVQELTQRTLKVWGRNVCTIKEKKIFPPTKTCSELSINKVLKGTSKAASAPTSYLLLLPHCFNFLSCLSQPLPPHWGPRQSSGTLHWPFQYHPSCLWSSGFTAPGFPSYSMSGHRAWSHLPCFIAKQVLTLAWAFICYAFAKTYTATVGHPAANTRGGDVCHHRTEPPDPSAEKK